MFIDHTDPNLEQCKGLAVFSSSTESVAWLVRHDLIQLNIRLHEQAEHANSLLTQCGIDATYALTQVESDEKISL